MMAVMLLKTLIGCLIVQIQHGSLPPQQGSQLVYEIRPHPKILDPASLSVTHTGAVAMKNWGSGSNSISVTNNLVQEVK